MIINNTSYSDPYVRVKFCVSNDKEIQILSHLSTSTIKRVSNTVSLFTGREEGGRGGGRRGGRKRRRKMRRAEIIFYYL